MLGLENRKEIKRKQKRHISKFYFLITEQQYKPRLNYNNSLN